MSIFNSLKFRYIAGLALVCFAFAPVLFVRAEEKAADPGGQKAADPNSPGISEDNPKTSDPNAVAEAADPNSAQKQCDAPAPPPVTEPPKTSAPTKAPLPEDPNSPDISEDNPKISDPNATAEEEGDDIFDIKVSTYLLINEAYGRIFTPQLITDDGRVDYARLKRRRIDVITAEKLLKKLSPAVMWSLSEEQRMAFWINTYNFCMIDVILRNYPIEPKWWNIIYPDNSVIQITGAWKKEFFEIQQLEYNLEEIEKEFLLDRYKDPRICFALHNASVGGPLLRNEPYTAENINAQIDEQVKKYLELPRGMRIDRENNIVYVSYVFRTKKDVFLNSKYADVRKFRDRNEEERAWLNFIFPYMNDEDKKYLDNNEFKIDTIDYDWHLNEKQ